jgi:hypothetical protein
MLNPSFQFASPNSKARYKSPSVVYSLPWVASLIVSSSFIVIGLTTKELTRSDPLQQLLMHSIYADYAIAVLVLARVLDTRAGWGYNGPVAEQRQTL